MMDLCNGLNVSHPTTSSSPYCHPFHTVRLIVWNEWRYGTNDGTERLTVRHESSYGTNDATDGNMDRLTIPQGWGKSLKVIQNHKRHTVCISGINTILQIITWNIIIWDMGAQPHTLPAVAKLIPSSDNYLYYYSSKSGLAGTDRHLSYSAKYHNIKTYLLYCLSFCEIYHNDNRLVHFIIL